MVKRAGDAPGESDQAKGANARKAAAIALIAQGPTALDTHQKTQPQRHKRSVKMFKVERGEHHAQSWNHSAGQASGLARASLAGADMLCTRAKGADTSETHAAPLRTRRMDRATPHIGRAAGRERG